MALPVADLPVLPADDSMLTRRFGREVANYFSGSPLNRVSFLRTDHAFLQAAFAHPAARFLLVDNLAPLVHNTTPPRLAWSLLSDVAPLTGTLPFAGTEEDAAKNFNSANDPHPIILFLGIDEKSKFAEPSTAAAPPSFTYSTFKGNPYFAVDVTPRGGLADRANAAIEAAKAKGLTFFTNARGMNLVAEEAAAYGQARALLDWNARNPFCAQCGQPTLSVNAGTKRVCPPTDLAGVADGQPAVDRKPCAARKGVSNLSFPRTDPTVIMACVSADGSRVLLGRNKRFPKDWYSTLAGFLEPGESVEEAVRREVWEESGVTVGRVVIHSSQPWPFPANLMIGAVAIAQPGEGETIFLGHDPELEDARWFSMDEVRNALLHNTAGLDEAVKAGYKEGDLRLPPRTAIANQLLVAVAEGFADANGPKI
ncbi:NADH pyrophosphatase [Grosmannia clavigera kw1407]|uniref:NAD(+) diphosphatase n=1 Tax=Grosmannia clavigera (strain kw1407 / UAMH 11150) TaxID=655863 RepID=F0XAG0_GROCL|nr:NADH pyrophosphatase [Grosmannia clavigera kw1407]EFX05795.1 NADH pyrophosphatase [Grosmannia clavigera kw1407]